MLPHIPATIHPAHRIERTFPKSAKLKFKEAGEDKEGYSDRPVKVQADDC
jgi:hypothetical protein